MGAVFVCLTLIAVLPLMIVGITGEQNAGLFVVLGGVMPVVVK